MKLLNYLLLFVCITNIVLAQAASEMGGLNSSDQCGKTTINTLPLCNSSEEYLLYNKSCYPYCTEADVTCTKGIFNYTKCACEMVPTVQDNNGLIFLLILSLIFLFGIWKSKINVRHKLVEVWKKIRESRKGISLLAVFLFLLVPLFAGAYLFYIDPQIKYSLRITEEPMGQLQQTRIYGSAMALDTEQPGIREMIQELFNMPPGFSWYKMCFEDTTVFNPPATKEQNIQWQLDSQDGKTYLIPRPDHGSLCIPFRVDKPFGARYHAGGSNVTLLPGQSITFSCPKITFNVDLGSVIGKIILFVIAFDALLILSYEVKSKIFKT